MTIKTKFIFYKVNVQLYIHSIADTMILLIYVDV